ncbi:MAG TPA: SDR family oxidoreductase [Acidobacteriaceae bacterium]|nr:SDR family oxidoreductase [Acidobacteriaceae bacterium]
MKIIVFGANGRTGKLIVTQALAKGHAVTAYVRNSDGLPQDPHLRVIQGDVLDFKAVVDAIRGHRAVLSALGANSRKKSDVLANAVPHILEGMRQEYVNRLIVLGAAGIDPDWGKYQNALTVMGLWVAKKTALRHPFVDQATQERLIAASDVDYTIVRAPRLTDGPFTGTYRVLPDALPSGATRINRADVADFMLQQLTDPRFHRQGPYIGARDS